MELGRPGVRAGVMCVVMLSRGRREECGGGECGDPDHTGETHYNVRTNLR